MAGGVGAAVAVAAALVVGTGVAVGALVAGACVAVGASVEVGAGDSVGVDWTTTSVGALIGSLASPDPPVNQTNAAPATPTITPAATSAATTICHLFIVSPFVEPPYTVGSGGALTPADRNCMTLNQEYEGFMKPEVL